MPSINLRLTEEEHAQLKEWAYGAHRSIQREAIFRLFDGRLSEAEQRVQPVSTEGGDEKRSAEHSVNLGSASESRPRKRLHPCKHHVPPSKACPYCDVEQA